MKQARPTGRAPSHEIQKEQDMKHFNRKLLQSMLSTTCIGLLAFSAMAIAGNSETADVNCADDSKLKDAWTDARLESAYFFNPHLNNFGITTEVENGNVRLNGTVRSEIDKDLAEEIAKSLDGVVAVENELVVKEEPSPETVVVNSEDREFGQMVTDATITAKVKTKLLANANIAGTEIDVDTENNVVMLTGQVESRVEKQLAEYIARNTSGVLSVNSHLTVAASSS
jgi:hyperosmotically inducible protein